MRNFCQKTKREKKETQEKDAEKPASPLFSVPVLFDMQAYGMEVNTLLPAS